jgi:hypothetical protein
MTDPAHALFIANTSLQTHILMFQLEKGGKTYEQRIPIGDQVQLLERKLTSEELQRFLQQKEKYGVRHVKEVSGDKSYLGLCYSVDNPVRLGELKAGFEHNAEIREEQQDARLEDSTSAIAGMLKDHLGDAPVAVKRATTELIEETKGEDMSRVARGVEFTADGVEPDNRGKRAKRR